MTRFTVYSNDRASRRRPDGPVQTMIASLSGWLQNLLTFLFQSPSGTPTGPTPRPKAGALSFGARLSEKTDAVARRHAA
jgi:hypothetical protein